MHADIPALPRTVCISSVPRMNRVCITSGYRTRTGGNAQSRLGGRPRIRLARLSVGYQELPYKQGDGIYAVVRYWALKVLLSKFLIQDRTQTPPYLKISFLATAGRRMSDFREFCTKMQDPTVMTGECVCEYLFIYLFIYLFNIFSTYGNRRLWTVAILKIVISSYFISERHVYKHCSVV